MEITVKARHMDVTNSVREYVESKVGKISRFYDSVTAIEVILDKDADQAVTEIVAHAKKKHTFVAHHRDENLYTSVDMCLDKLAQQLRRHKDRVRDRQGPSHAENAAHAEAKAAAEEIAEE